MLAGYARQIGPTITVVLLRVERIATSNFSKSFIGHFLYYQSTHHNTKFKNDLFHPWKRSVKNEVQYFYSPVAVCF